MTIHPKLYLRRKRAIDALHAYETLRKHRLNVALSDIATDYVRVHKANQQLLSCSLKRCCKVFCNSIPKSQVRNWGTYRSLARRILETLPPDLPLKSLTEADCVKVLEPSKHPGTYNSRLRRMKALLNWAVRQKYISQNPIATLVLKPRPYCEPCFFHAEDVERIFSVVDACPYEHDKPIGMFLALGFYAGLRTSEILRARWEDINCEEEFIRIPKPKGITNGGKPRIVELEPRAIRLLRKFVAMSNSDKSSLVVPSVWKISQWKKTHLEPLGLSWGNDTYHNVMRHTYATMHVAAFRAPATTALNLGHGESLRILEKHYRGLVGRAEGKRYWGEED